MITRLEIKGFKSLVDVALDLGAVNVFIGANGSGKSNLLEAIGFLGAIISGVGEHEGYRYRGVRPGDPDSFVCHLPNREGPEIHFCVNDIVNVYSVQLAPGTDRAWEIRGETIQDEHQRSLKRVGTLYSFKHGWLEHQRSAEANEHAQSLAEMVQQFLSSSSTPTSGHNRAMLDVPLFHRLKSFAIYTPTTPQLRGSQDDIHRDPLGLGGSGLPEAVEQMMRADAEMLGPFALEDIIELIEWANAIGTNSVGRSAETPVRLRLGDRFMRNERKNVSAVEASEGALYVLFMLALVGYERSPKMFAVDNFDQALHPRLAQKLTRMVCDQIVADGTRQMFATTHNPLVLNGLNLRDDRIRLFTVDRDAAGATVVKRVEVSEALMAKAEAGFPLSELWTTGWLGGGLPQNY